MLEVFQTIANIIAILCVAIVLILIVNTIHDAVLTRTIAKYTGRDPNEFDAYVYRPMNGRDREADIKTQQAAAVADAEHEEFMQSTLDEWQTLVLATPAEREAIDRVERKVEAAHRRASTPISPERIEYLRLRALTTPRAEVETKTQNKKRRGAHRA